MTTNNDTTNSGAYVSEPFSADQILQDKAHNLMNTVYTLIQNKADSLKMDALIQAAYTLLDASGGRDNPVGVWLLGAQAHVADIKGYPLDSVRLSLLCYKKAESVFGKSHVNSIFCFCNFASAFATMGLSHGESMLAHAIQKLKQASPAPDAPQEKIDKTIAVCQKVLAEVKKWQTPEETLAQFKRVYIRPGFTTGILDAQLRAGNQNIIDATYKYKRHLDAIPDEHKRIFKGLQVSWRQHAPATRKNSKLH